MEAEFLEFHVCEERHRGLVNEIADSPSRLVCGLEDGFSEALDRFCVYNHVRGHEVGSRVA